MSEALCSCVGVIANTGKSLNDKKFGRTEMNIFVPLKKTDGTPNTIDPTGDIAAQLLAGFTAEDPRERFYPVKDLQNVTFPNEGDQFVTGSNGLQYKTRLGIQSMNYEVWGVSYQYINQLRDVCTQFGIYRVDKCGRILGRAYSDTDLRPLEVNNESLSVTPMDAVDDNVQKASVAFQLMPVEMEQFGNWKILDDTTAKTAVGMLDAVVTPTVDSATTATLNINEIYGYAGAPNGITGLQTADVTLVNYTQDTEVALGGLAASATVDGQYTATFTAQVTSDQISFRVYKAGATIDLPSYYGESAQVAAL